MDGADAASVFKLIETVGFGFLGGVLIECLKWYQVRKDIRPLRDAITSLPTYWFSSFTMWLAGGVIVYAHVKSGSQLSPLTALNLGAITPLVIASLGDLRPKSGGP